ncbi:hypothetical protein RHGRI_029476 [Rhododendron griersonianum]|uniref:Uncharacterized protein n=1 Tax=Rhododendron griersonianum TaxID=479676 RepID=A0AAV6IJH1_9ERIC|nr:hypothetical protein RHGRI_029476 [Rhododendron griersonianum]
MWFIWKGRNGAVFFYQKVTCPDLVSERAVEYFQEFLTANPLSSSLIGTTGGRDWYCGQVNGKSLKSISLHCSLAATVYGLWRERNCRIFQGKVMGHDQVLNSIEADVRDFLSSRRKMKLSSENQSLCRNWGLSNRIFLPV